MSQTKAHPAKESDKKHGHPLASTMDEVDAHDVQDTQASAIPPAENGGLAKSAAAHVGGGGEPHTKPAGNLRQGSHPGALREPPMVTQRVGKQHRGS